MCQHHEGVARRTRRAFLRRVAGLAAGGALAASGLPAGAAAPKTCPTCKGKGQVLGDCAVCKGTGKSETGNRCQTCAGTGKFYQFCSACAGRGDLPDNPAAEEEACGLVCIEKDSGSCVRPKHHRGFHHCSKGHIF